MISSWCEWTLCTSKNMATLRNCMDNGTAEGCALDARHLCSVHTNIISGTRRTRRTTDRPRVHQPEAVVVYPHTRVFSPWRKSHTNALSRVSKQSHDDHPRVSVHPHTRVFSPWRNSHTNALSRVSKQSDDDHPRASTGDGSRRSPNQSASAPHIARARPRRSRQPRALALNHQQPAVRAPSGIARGGWGPRRGVDEGERDDGRRRW